MKKYSKVYMGAILSVCTTLSLASTPDLYVINDGPKAITIVPGDADAGSRDIQRFWMDDLTNGYAYGGDDPCNTVLHNQHSDSLTIQPGEEYQIVDTSQQVDNWWEPWHGYPFNTGNYCSYVVSVVGSGKVTHLTTTLTKEDPTSNHCTEGDFGDYPYDCDLNGDGRITDVKYKGGILHIATPK